MSLRKGVVLSFFILSLFDLNLFSEVTTAQSPQSVSLGFSHVVRKIKDCVVNITAQQSQPKRGNDEMARRFSGSPLEEFFRNFVDGGADLERQVRKIHVAGSGFFIKITSKYAYVVTNNHIVENGSNVKVVLNDKTEIPATIHGVDVRSDLAVLRIDLKHLKKDKIKMIKALVWGNSDRSEVGDWVLAVGNPFGLGHSVTHGIISAKSRDLRIGGSAINDDFIQHSAQINVGNSGGCLVNMDGDVIGINTVIITPSAGHVGVGFAIPAKLARKVVDQLILEKKVNRGALGVKVQDFTKDMADCIGLKKYEQGALVASVELGGPAEKAGIKEGDIIVKFDDTLVCGSQKLSRVVGDTKINTSHKITVVRNNKERVFNVVLGDFDVINKTDSKKEEAKENKHKVLEMLGIRVSEISKDDASGKKTPAGKEQIGVKVVSVKNNSPASDCQIMPGDIIETVNMKKVTCVKDLEKILDELIKNKKKKAVLTIRREGSMCMVTLNWEDLEELEDMNKKNDNEKKKEPGESKKTSEKDEDLVGEVSGSEEIEGKEEKADEVENKPLESEKSEENKKEDDDVSTSDGMEISDGVLSDSEEDVNTAENKEEEKFSIGRFFSKIWGNFKK